MAGDQVPTIPFGEVVFKIGAAVPEQSCTGVTLKLGTVPFVTVKLIVSVSCEPQLLVMVSVRVTIVPALALLGV
ncbi:hypothetical protein D3C80_1146250 [compost metagenome]